MLLIWYYSDVRCCEVYVSPHNRGQYGGTYYSNYYIFITTYFRIKKKKKIPSLLHVSLGKINQWLWVMFSL